MISWYVVFNLTEGIVWWGIALYFLVNWRDGWINLALSLALLFFGTTDFIESLIQGPLPWWLWAAKIIGGLTLFGLLIVRDYRARGAIALSPWRFSVALIILALALFCIAAGD